MIEEKIKELSGTQKELVKQIQQINKEKLKFLEDNLSVNKNNVKRLQEVAEKLKITNKDVDAQMKELFQKICARIFTSSLKLERTYKGTDSYYHPGEEDKIAFTSKGLAYKPRWRDKLRSIDDLKFTIDYFNRDPTLRDIPLSKQKLVIWQPFFDAMKEYKFKEKSVEEKILLEEPIITYIDTDTDHISEAIFSSVKQVKIEQVSITISGGRKRIEFSKKSTGSSWSTWRDAYFTLDIDEGRIEDSQNIRYFINQIPDVVFNKLNEITEEIKKRVDENLVVYNKIRENFGHLLLVGEV